MPWNRWGRCASTACRATTRTDRRPAVPPTASSLFSVDGAKPLGLAALAVNLQTDAARGYVFP